MSNSLDSLMLAGWDLHDVLGRPLTSEPITMHWKHKGKLGCSIDISDSKVASMHCDAFHYLTLKDSFCSLCAEAARQALDKEAEVEATK